MNFFNNLLKFCGLSLTSTNEQEIERRVNSVVAEKQRRWAYEEMRKREHINLSVFIGEFVMVVSNEHENPLIGKAIGIDTIGFDNSSYVLIVENILTGEVVPTLGHIMIFSWQKFDALHKMTFDERIALIFGRYTDETIKKSSSTMNPPYPNDVFRKMVEEAIQKYAS